MKYVGTYSDPKDIVTKDKLEAVASRVSTNEDNIAMAESDIDGLQTDVGTLKTNVNNVQTALTSKQDTVVGGASTITADNLTANRALVSNSSGKVAVSTVTSTELGYLDGVTSNVQTQLNKKLEKAPVTSVNGKTGAVTLGKSDIGLGNVDNVKQYSVSNPPPYPVTSVNGQTGDVTVSADLPEHLVKYQSLAPVEATTLVDANTLQGHDAAYFAKQSDVNTINSQVSTNTSDISALQSGLSTANANIANKLDKSGGTMTGALVAQSNTNYTTAQVRNVIISPNEPSGGQSGDLWIKYSS